MITCFGKVLKIEYVEKKYYPNKSPRIHLYKTHEMENGEYIPINKKVILTNPTAFICGEEINEFYDPVPEKPEGKK
jgi:hypothetical protein